MPNTKIVHEKNHREDEGDRHAGLAIGSADVTKHCQRVAPSIRAASSNSSGVVSKYDHDPDHDRHVTTRWMMNLRHQRPSRPSH